MEPGGEVPRRNAMSCEHQQCQDRSQKFVGHELRQLSHGGEQADVQVGLSQR